MEFLEASNCKQSYDCLLLGPFENTSYYIFKSFWLNSLPYLYQFFLETKGNFIVKHKLENMMFSYFSLICHNHTYKSQNSKIRNLGFQALLCISLFYGSILNWVHHILHIPLCNWRPMAYCLVYQCCQDT